jgi:hypothetical protein
VRELLGRYMEKGQLYALVESSRTGETDSPELRDEGRLDVANSGPVDARKEDVALDLVGRVPSQPRLVSGDHPLSVERASQRPLHLDLGASELTS